MKHICIKKIAKLKSPSLFPELLDEWPHTLFFDSWMACYFLQKKKSSMIFFYLVGVTDPTTINSDTTLGDLGLDSLMGVEVKQTLERDYDLTLTMKEVRHLTVNKLHEIAHGESSENTAEQPQERKEDKKVEPVLKSLVPTDLMVKLNNVEGEPRLFFIHPLEGS